MRWDGVVERVSKDGICPWMNRGGEVGGSYKTRVRYAIEIGEE